MKNPRFRQTVSCILFSCVLFFTACQKESSGQPLSPPEPNRGSATVAGPASSSELLPLKPGPRERRVAQVYVRLLETQHISQRQLDARVSKEALRLYIKGLDPLKLYFYQSDIDEFKKNYETRICDLAKNNDIEPAFVIYNRYLERVKERVDMIMKILAAPLDFTIDEDLVRDKSKEFTLDDKVIAEKGLLRWPATPEEAYDRWRKRIKNEVLALKDEARNKEKDRVKALAEGKEPPKETEKRDPIERLQKRYISFRKRMLLENHIEDGKILEDIRKAANDDVMEAYLSSISGALDPHTSYMSPSTLENFRHMMEKALEGIGATLTSEDGYTVVKKLVKGGPAEKSQELKTDDKIIGVGQGKEGKIEDVVDARLSDVVKLIRGDKGTVVRLEVIPADGGTTKIIEIVRDKVDLEDQAAKRDVFEVGKKEDGSPYKIGVIDLPDFYADMEALRRGQPNARSTTGDVRRFLREFVEQNVDAVVLDLRMNGGGSLLEAIALTGLFIETGNVVQTKDESSSRPQERNDPDPSCEWTGPLVVVISKFSASASEIFAGAIKDYRRGLIVGDSRTHGKGTVQQMRDLNDELLGQANGALGAMKITIQGFYRPSGVSPQGEGVSADVVIPSTIDVLEDICESDLPNALVLNRVTPAKNFPKLPPYVNPQVDEELQKRMNARIEKNEDFQKLEKEIAAYKEIRNRKTTPLNEEKYFAEQDRLNEGRREKDQLEDLLDKEGKIDRNYYMEEVLNISVDYINVLKEKGIAFPKSRTVTAKPSPLNFLFGR